MGIGVTQLPCATLSRVTLPVVKLPMARHKHDGSGPGVLYYYLATEAAAHITTEGGKKIIISQ